MEMIWIFRGLFILAGLAIIALFTKGAIDEDFPKER